MATLINSFKTGTEYLQVNKDGSSSYSREPMTKDPPNMKDCYYIDPKTKEHGQLTVEKAVDKKSKVYTDKDKLGKRKKELKINGKVTAIEKIKLIKEL